MKNIFKQGLMLGFFALSMLSAQMSNAFYLAFATERGIEIWDTETWKKVKFLEHRVNYGKVRFSSDGRYLHFIGGGNSAKWDLSTWEKTKITRKNITDEDKVKLRKLRKQGLLSPDSRYEVTTSFMTAVNDRELAYPGILIVDPKGEHILHIKDANVATFGPNGQYLAFGHDDGTIKIWDVSNKDPKNWKEMKSLTGSDGDTPWGNLLVFSPNGRYLAFGYRGGTIKVWDTKTWEVIQSLSVCDREEQSRINNLLFSPDNKYLTSSLENGKTVEVWNVETGKLIETLKSRFDKIISVAFRPFTEKEKMERKAAKQDPKERIEFLRQEEDIKKGEEVEIKIEGKEEFKIPKAFFMGPYIRKVENLKEKKKKLEQELKKYSGLGTLFGLLKSQKYKDTEKELEETEKEIGDIEKRLEK